MVTHQIVAYLISLAVGYWILTLSEKEKGKNKTIGQVIGWIIIVVSLAGPLCIGACHLLCRTQSGSCSYSSCCPGDGHGMSSCPEMGKGMMGGAAPSADQGKTK